jgi:hypothetical protein
MRHQGFLQQQQVVSILEYLMKNPFKAGPSNVWMSSNDAVFIVSSFMLTFCKYRRYANPARNNPTITAAILIPF